MNELQIDADLLMASDQWLYAERDKLLLRLELLVGEITDIEMAVDFKVKMQQSNLVATMVDGKLVISKMSDAIKSTNNSTTLKIWEADGYDVGFFTGQVQ